MNLRTLSRGACALLLFSALPAVAPAAVTPIDAPAAATVENGPPAATLASYPAQGRYVLVDAASQRLFMVEDGQLRDSMKVVVGKPGSQTPMLASRIYSATLNPYWNVPPDLAQKLIAPRVLEQGLGYLDSHHYQVVTSFEDDAEVVEANTVDWQAVADGLRTAYVRQLPGGSNAMGKVKFAFTNHLGIFLHDTPDKQLFEASERTFSNGCVRLEDAHRLGRWLIGGELVAASDEPEQKMMLPRPVPVFITYLDAPPATDRIANWSPSATGAIASR